MYEPQPRPPGGPPQTVRWLAFAGWLVLPILVTWAVVIATDLSVLWWGVVWFAAALVYSIGYFRWAKRRFPKQQ